MHLWRGSPNNKFKLCSSIAPYHKHWGIVQCRSYRDFCRDHTRCIIETAILLQLDAMLGHGSSSEKALLALLALFIEDKPETYLG